MKYSIKANSSSQASGSIHIKQSEIIFGTTEQSTTQYANPAELFLGSFASCILKNVERFSDLLNFEYSKAEVSVNAIRKEKPPRIEEIEYELNIWSSDKKLNIDLLKKNIEKFGTIFNTANASCSVIGKINKIDL